MVRKSRGRQKVEMVKMANDSNLQVTFSKRRSGLFKKASELCTLCGVEVAIIVFSPGRKVFSFGHPCVETVIDRFLSPNAPSHHQNSGTMQLFEAHRSATVRDLNAELTKVTNELEVERKRGEELTKLRKASQGQFWWESPVEEMDMSQCKQLSESLEELKKVVAKQAERVMIAAKPNPFFGAGSSSSHPNLMTKVGFNGMPAGMPPHPYPHEWNTGYDHGRFF